MKTMMKKLFPKTSQRLALEGFDEGKLYGRQVEYQAILTKLRVHNLDNFSSPELRLGYNQALQMISEIYDKENK